MGRRARNPDTERIVEFVRDRLRRIVQESDAPHGKQAEFARALKVTPAHVSNVLSGKVGIGEHMRRAALPLLGFNSMAELEAAALDRPLPPPPGDLDYRDPAHFALIARAAARDMGIGRRIAEAFIMKCSVVGLPAFERLATELRIFDGVMAASRPADAGEIGRMK